MSNKVNNIGRPNNKNLVREKININAILLTEVSNQMRTIQGLKYEQYNRIYLTTRTFR